MVELGLYAVARVYWTVFSGPLALQTGNLRNIFVGAGVLTALLGGLLCFGCSATSSGCWRSPRSATWG